MNDGDLVEIVRQAILSGLLVIAPVLLAGNGRDDVHLLVVCTAERGLCGGFNSSIVRLTRAGSRASAAVATASAAAGGSRATAAAASRDRDRDDLKYVGSQAMRT